MSWRTVNELASRDDLVVEMREVRSIMGNLRFAAECICWAYPSGGYGVEGDPTAGRMHQAMLRAEGHLLEAGCSGDE
jgi:hypothetical protein